MEKENRFIKMWKDGAKMICTMYVEMGKDYKEELKRLADEQMSMIIENRPDKNKTAKEQMNQEQLELFEYLNKVMQTGELQ